MALSEKTIAEIHKRITIVDAERCDCPDERCGWCRDREDRRERLEHILWLDRENKYERKTEYLRKSGTVCMTAHEIGTLLLAQPRGQMVHIAVGYRGREWNYRRVTEIVWDPDGRLVIRG